PLRPATVAVRSGVYGPPPCDSGARRMPTKFETSPPGRAQQVLPDARPTSSRSRARADWSAGSRASKASSSPTAAAPGSITSSIASSQKACCHASIPDAGAGGETGALLLPAKTALAEGGQDPGEGGHVPGLPPPGPSAPTGASHSSLPWPPSL